MSLALPVLSLQLYSLRQLGDLEAQLDAAAKAGFVHVETIGSHLDNPSALKSALASHGLTAPTGHIGLPALRGDLSRIADSCLSCGIGQLFMPALPAEERSKTAQGWQRSGAELGAIAAKLSEKGVELGYHNHHWELDPLEGGGCGLQRLFEGAEGSPLTWQADIAWLARAAVNPVDWLDRYSHLLVAAHVKDQARSGEHADEDGWTDVGSGILDWPSLWNAAIGRGARVMVVEHDNPKDPAGFAARSFGYLRRFELAA